MKNQTKSPEAPAGHESPAQIPIGTPIDTRKLYHPGALYAPIGTVEEYLGNGGMGVRFEHLHGGHSTVADFTPREVARLVREGRAL